MKLTHVLALALVASSAVTAFAADAPATTDSKEVEVKASEEVVEVKVADKK